jgi:hypothetical protein
MYAQDQLPGGSYWEPDEEVEKILPMPNLHQMARSNLIQVKKNKTLKWLSSLKEEEQCEIIDIAVKQRRFVSNECRVAEENRAKQRQQNMLIEHDKRMTLEKKLQEEKDKMSQLHLITSSVEL